MIPQKRTKIVATIGPSSQEEKMLEKLVKAGLNVIRLNFSHGDFAEHQVKVDRAREITKRTGRPIGILQDLAGPKIRIGDFDTSTGRITLKKGKEFILSTKKIKGDENQVYVNYKGLSKDLKKGDFVLLDDGKKKLEVTKISGEKIYTKVIIGGDTKGRRGVNLPGANLKISSITAKDKKDLEFGIKNDVDFIALSFVRNASDVRELKKLIKGKVDAMIVSKIETQQAIDNFDEILAETDAVMVARGDLAIEVPAEDVPMIQKEIIEKCNEVGKPVITATQMLESMISSPVPTRAEVSDVANAIADGTDAIMLSEETTLGEYPLEAVEMMTRIALATEDGQEIGHAFHKRNCEIGTTNSVTASVVNTAHDVYAKAIIAVTDSGWTGRMISRHKPDPVVLAVTSQEKVFNQLSLSFGCYPVLSKKFSSVENIFEEVRGICQKAKIATKGDRVVIAAHAPFDDPAQHTNLMLVEKI